MAEIRELSADDKAMLLMKLRLKHRNIGLAREAIDLREEKLAICVIRRLTRAKARRRHNQTLQINQSERILLRKEARASHLAYGFIRGVDYLAMEGICYTQPDWERVEEIVAQFTKGVPHRLHNTFPDWMGGAKSSASYQFDKNEHGKWVQRKKPDASAEERVNKLFEPIRRANQKAYEERVKKRGAAGQ